MTSLDMEELVERDDKRYKVAIVGYAVMQSNDYCANEELVATSITDWSEVTHDEYVLLVKYTNRISERAEHVYKVLIRPNKTIEETIKECLLVQTRIEQEIEEKKAQQRKKRLLKEKEKKAMQEQKEKALLEKLKQKFEK